MELQGGYIRSFETETQFNEERNGNYYEPWVSYTQNITRVDYNKTEKERLRDTPLTFEITGDGDIIWHAVNTAFTRTIEYKKNDGEWTSITSATGDSAPSIGVSTGDIVQFRGDNAFYSSGSSRYNCFSGTTCGFKVKGNIMSLIDSTDFAALSTLQRAYTFCGLFCYCNGLTDASDLVLVATTLANNCYSNMFFWCINLVNVPELPATTLADYCYSQMFHGCTNLVNAPELPATTLAPSCYYSMFQDCASLVTAPELPATTLAGGCYSYMFVHCVNLVNVQLPATTLAGSCYVYMFAYCNSLITAPELPATTLANYCYRYMFAYCNNLITAPELPSTTLAEDCYSLMFRECRSLVNAPELPAATLVRGCYDSMFYDCTNLNYIKCLATDISANNCTNNWVHGVQTSSGTFVKNPNITTTTWGTGVSGIPNRWTVQDAS